MSNQPTISILGRKKDTCNYEQFLVSNGFFCLTTLNPGEAAACDGLILPGGGDITPAFFGETNKGSRSIDTELDILQFQTLELCIQHHIPVLGICKGMQLINIAFGGTLTQNMPTAHLHQSIGQDLFHDTYFSDDSCLTKLYPDYNPDHILVNSCHHQCLNKLGTDLSVIQYAGKDHCPEAIRHASLPILGLQWHPERMPKSEEHFLKGTIPGAPVLSLFLQGLP